MKEIRRPGVFWRHFWSLYFTPDRGIDAIRAIRSAIHGFVLLELEGGFALPRDLDASFATLTRMLTRGLAELGGDLP